MCTLKRFVVCCLNAAINPLAQRLKQQHTVCDHCHDVPSAFHSKMLLYLFPWCQWTQQSPGQTPVSMQGPTGGNMLACLPVHPRMCGVVKLRVKVSLSLWISDTACPCCQCKSSYRLCVCLCQRESEAAASCPRSSC